MKKLLRTFYVFYTRNYFNWKALKLNPFDQPAVELIKKETKKILI